MRQIGNAVPPMIGEVFGLAIVRALCKPRRVPAGEHVHEQDEAAGGYFRRHIVVGGRRVTASVRIQKEYAWLNFTRSAGNPVYLGKVQGSDKRARLRDGWRLAHEEHADLFMDLKQRDAA